jgi:hypothetical protein
LLVGIIAGSSGAFPAGALAKKAAKLGDPPCSLSQNAAGDLIAAASGLASNANYEYQVYSAPQTSVGGGELSTDGSGNFSADLGSLSFFMSVYSNETTLTVNVYPIIGNKANMNTVVASCSITP